MKNLLCKIFGHKRREKIWTGEYGKMFYALTLQEIEVPIMRWEYLKKCPRCGARLEK